ncbi:hypothetical protein Tco_0927299 [Tanacetum coccineum]
MSSSTKSSGDFSTVEGVQEDPDAPVVSMSMTRLAVTVNSGTSWAARGTHEFASENPNGIPFVPGNSGCKSSGIPYSDVNSRRYSPEMVDTASSSCIAPYPFLLVLQSGVLTCGGEIPWQLVAYAAVCAKMEV